LRIPPAPPAPTTLPPPHVCISGGGIIDDEYDGNEVMDDDEMDDDDDCQMHLSDDMNVMDAELNNDAFISITSMNNANNNNVNHYMNIQSTINPNSGANDQLYYQNVMQMNGESV
jgi:hypothetical protein